MKNQDNFVQIALLIFAISFFIAGLSTSCATLDKEEVLSVHDRTVTLYMEAVTFVHTFELTVEQEAKIASMITRAELIYKDIVELYGKSSDIAARWDVLVATLKLIK